MALVPASAWRFGVVGSVGFVVDAGLLTWLTSVGLDVVRARCLSFAVAVGATFMLNRAFTFRASAQRRPLAQFARYWGVQISGASVNFLVFLALVRGFPALERQPWLPLGVASICALLLTYTLSRLVFEGKRRQ